MFFKKDGTKLPMTMSIDELGYDSGDSVFYTSAFRAVLTSYIMYFQDPNNNVMTTTILDPLAPVVFNGDLAGLLFSLNIPAQYHWFVMVLNGMDSPSDFDESYTQLNLPDIPTIERIKNTYETSSI